MKKKGFLSGFIGTLLVLVGVLAATVLTSLLANVVFKVRFNNGEAICAVLKLTLFVILVYFILLEVIFFAWQIKLAKNGNKNADEASRQRSAKTFRTVCIACLSAIVLFAIINVNTYTEYKEDGISEKIFVTAKEYKWQNVLYYSLSCDRYGDINFNIKMKDGKTFELLNTVTSCSDEFIDKYENMYGYAAYLASEFENQPNYIEKRLSGVDFMEKYYKENYPDVWKYLSAIIGEEDQDQDQNQQEQQTNQ